MCKQITNPDRLVALKLFKEDYFRKEKNAIKLIENEISILHGLKHENINKLIGYGNAGKLVKADGEELHDLIYMILEYTPKLFYDLVDENGPMGEANGRMFLK